MRKEVFGPNNHIPKHLVIRYLDAQGMAFDSRFLTEESEDQLLKLPKTSSVVEPTQLKLVKFGSFFQVLVGVNIKNV